MKTDKQIGGEQMRNLANLIQPQINGLGFALLVFPFNEPGMSNYISNAERKDMIKALREAADRFEKNQDFKTPETN